MDHNKQCKVKVDMLEQARKIAEEFEMEHELPESAKMPTADHSFKVNPNSEKLNEKLLWIFTLAPQKDCFL